MRSETRRDTPSPWACFTLLAALTLFSGCGSPPLLRYQPDAAPAVLMPAALAGIEDARARYREILCAVLRTQDPTAGASLCEASLHRMALEGEPTGRAVHLGPPRIPLRVGIVPGYGADCFTDVVPVLADARSRLAERGWPTDVLIVEGLSSSRRNADLIRDQLLKAQLAHGERFVLIGYSKGTSDMLEALAVHPEIRPRVAAAVSLAGTVMGSPLADDPPRLLPVLVQALSGGACTAGDGGAFASLRRTERLEFLARFPPLSYGVPLYSLGAFADLERTSHILRPMHRRRVPQCGSLGCSLAAGSVPASAVSNIHGSERLSQGRDARIRRPPCRGTAPQQGLSGQALKGRPLASRGGGAAKPRSVRTWSGSRGSRQGGRRSRRSREERIGFAVALDERLGRRRDRVDAIGLLQRRHVGLIA